MTEPESFRKVSLLMSIPFPLILIMLMLGDQKTADKPPETIVFETKMGQVTFDHSEHVKRVEGDCEACHDKLFPRSRALLNFKKGMHKQAEAKKESCAGCHGAGGQAFASKGNCKKCHVKNASKG